MEMCVADGLARGPSNVHPEVEPVWPIRLVELRAQLCGHAQNRVPLLWKKREKIRLVTVGNDEDMSGIEWLSVVERDA
jgi:hypothetical protein